MGESARDGFEAEHMPTAGRLLRREKQVQRYHWVFLLLAGVFGLGSVGALAAAALTPSPLVPALLTMIPTLAMLALWVTFSVLRVHLSDRELLVRLGPFGPRIALENIETCRLIARTSGVYRTGVRLRDGLWEHSYMMSRDRPELVEVMFRDGGKRKRMVMTSSDPAALVRSIEEARAAALAPQRSRVATSDEAAPETETEAAAEAEAGAAIETERKASLRSPVE